MEKILLTRRDDIFVIKNFLSAEESDRLVARSEAIGFDEATINSYGGTIINKNMRNNERVIVDDVLLAHELWPKLEPFVVDLKKGHFGPVGLNERFRFYRYDPGQFFDWHFDGAYQRNHSEISQLTFMLYLNDGYAGGTTDFSFKIGVFTKDDPFVTAVPEKGMALIFTHNVLHRGDSVKTGRKYVLRSDVMYRRS